MAEIQQALEPDEANASMRTLRRCELAYEPASKKRGWRAALEHLRGANHYAKPFLLATAGRSFLTTVHFRFGSVLPWYPKGKRVDVYMDLCLGEPVRVAALRVQDDGKAVFQAGSRVATKPGTYKISYHLQGHDGVVEQSVFVLPPTKQVSTDEKSSSLNEPFVHVGKRFFYFNSKVSVPFYAGARRERSQRLYFAVFQGSSPSSRIDHCVLVHGYGVSQKILDTISSNRFRHTFMASMFRLFVDSYYTQTFIDKLLAGPCRRVLVLLQNSVDTPILAMTKRVEALLGAFPCRSGACALYGHSKGGAVVTTIARRCMDRTSVMGEAACRHMTEVYSSAGVPLGASAAIALVGVQKAVKAEPSDLHAYELGIKAKRLYKVFGWTFSAFSQTSADPLRNNPTWYDLGPMAPMEHGVLLAEINNVRLEKKGWLRADYSASSSNYQFVGDGKEAGLSGCSGIPPNEKMAKRLCQLFTRTVVKIHTADLEYAYHLGLRQIRIDAQFRSSRSGDYDYLKPYSWASYQASDGMADRYSAIQICSNGGSAVESCKLFELNHLANAGASTLVQDHVVGIWSR